MNSEGGNIDFSLVGRHHQAATLLANDIVDTRNTSYLGQRSQTQNKRCQCQTESPIIHPRKLSQHPGSTFQSYCLICQMFQVFQISKRQVKIPKQRNNSDFSILQK